MQLNPFIKYIVSFSCFCFSAVPVCAQRGYTMNFLSQTPQQVKYNPAYYTSYNTYVGIAGIQMQVNNDFLSINRLLKKGVDTTVIDIQNFIGKAFNKNNLGLELGADLFQFGFKINKKNQIHIGLGVEGYANLQITKNTFSFLLRGPGYFMDRGETEALSGNSVDMNLYGVFSLGYSRMVTQKLSVGARIKFLSGIANVFTESSDVVTRIDNGYDPNITPYSYIIKPDVSIKGAFSACPEDSNMLYALKSLFSGDVASIIATPEKLTDNFGVGFDIGATYDVSEELTLGVSVYDIGRIKWNKGLKKIASQNHDEAWKFSGVGKLQDILNDDDFEIKNVINELKDSALNYFQLKDQDSNFISYTSNLRTSFNLSAFFDFTDRDQFGIMWNQQLGGQKNRAITLAYTRFFGPRLSLSLSNAIVGENIFNFGGGLVANLGNLQLHLIVDKISSHRIVDMRAINLHLGICLTFGRTEKDPNKQRSVRDYTPRDKTGYVNDRWYH